MKQTQTAQQLQQQKAIQHELQQLRKKYETARKIVTAEGFYQTWFNSLPHFNSGAEAFRELNQLHYNTVLPARYKYSDYQCFLRAVRNNNFKKKTK